ncbi:uncharacterized protein TRUGW13939_10294 [Talaromyces rugulosus]|uniref:Uncharacterized protein n=1 Tax=Talaromyces rugulosus TaxID=121627 RepID=A0A7H8RA00_TALRU|nr:uncharacterized protein TRUGW13939_10294 [Talaromyces rugulosus]QKX63126.1 hypothetical protein TRUGW13939_10294 [Talaromyces rugulosus]
MAEKSNPYFFSVLNAGSLLLPLYVVGSTLRFLLISVTLILWLQTQCLGYISILKKRRSARLAAAADEVRIRQRKQIADISRSVGENVILLLETSREQVLKLNQEAERKIQEYEQATVDRQESERAKDQQLKSREENILVQERKIKESEEALQALQKKLEEREQNVKIAEDNARKIYLKQEEFRRPSHQIIQPTAPFNPVAPPLIKSTLPSDLLEYSNDLRSLFTCIGVTKKGTRCRQSMIANADKSAAIDRIEKMTSSNPEDTFELNVLRELADWMLCPRWHRYALPQGATIARRWYDELSDARAKLKSRTQTHMNTLTPITTPSSAITSSSTLPSAGVPSVFSSYSTGTASSIASPQSVSMSYTGSSYQVIGPQAFMNPQGASDAAPGNHPARNLMPLFEAVAQQSRSKILFEENITGR